MKEITIESMKVNYNEKGEFYNIDFILLYELEVYNVRCVYRGKYLIDNLDMIIKNSI